MENLEIYYSVQNGGDGSAYPRLMESLELAEWDQTHMIEGWGESCTGSFNFTSDSLINCIDKIQTKESYFLDTFLYDIDVEGDASLAPQFVENFFPNGFPLFVVKINKINNINSKDYLSNEIYINEKLIHSVYRSKVLSGKVLEDKLNSLNTIFEKWIEKV